MRVGAFQFFLLVLSVYVLVSLLVEMLWTLDSEVVAIIQFADNVICIFFLADFIYRFFKAESKFSFMRWGWIDLLSSIPMVDAFRVGRLVRVFRVLKVLRAARSMRVLGQFLFASRMNGVFASVSAISLLMVVFGAIAILNVEIYDDSNIKTAGDALWWAFVTITTVGYGDYYPVSFEGRVIAAALMTTGVGLFGTFTAFVASWFIDEQETAQDVEISALRAEVSSLHAKLDKIEDLIKQLKLD